MASTTPRNQYARGNKPAWMTGTGPYVGRVANHLDTEFMGSIEVEIMKTTEAGSPTESSGYYIPCTYVSPFLGQTPRKGVAERYGFDYTQKSYGFWGIPPDIDTKVLVLMAENNFGFGYWVGCIQDKFMNFMMPGNASTGYSTESSAGKYSNKIVPVGEYNKTLESGTGSDPTQYYKFVDTDQADILEKQGLTKWDENIVDQTRGTTTSSARREVPSMVVGISSPGHPDRRNGKPKVPYGEKFGQTNVPFNRLGGTSFVFDDGDGKILRKKPANTHPPEYSYVEKNETDGDVTLPHNELTRWRTRTGHQIVMHNTEDLIYVINAQGNAWIELTSNGKIDIYTDDSVSIHSETDFNLKANRDINLEASGNVNIKAREQMRLESGNATHWKVGTAEIKKDPALRSELGIKNEDGTWKWNSFEDLPTVEQPGDNLYIDVSRDVYWKIGTHPEKGDMKVEISQDHHITIDRDRFILVKENIHQHSNKSTFTLSDEEIHQHSTKSTFILSNDTLDIKADKEFFQLSGADMHIKSDKDCRIFASTNAVLKSTNNYINGSAANHMVAATNYITGSGSNEYNAPQNNMSMIQNFGSGSATGSPGVTASPATNAQDAIDAVLPECAHHTFIPIRIPTHEPYFSHENLKPEQFYPDKTDSTISINDDCVFAINYEQEEIKAPITFKGGAQEDTFRKGR